MIFLEKKNAFGKMKMPVDKEKTVAVQQMLSVIEDEYGDGGENHTSTEQMGMLFDAGYRKMHPDAKDLIDFVDSRDLIMEFQDWLNPMPPEVKAALDQASEVGK